MCGCHEASGGLKGGQRRGPQWGRADLKRGAGLWIPPHPAASCGVERAFLFQRAFLSKNVANFRMPLSKGDTSTHPPFRHSGGNKSPPAPLFCTRWKEGSFSWLRKGGVPAEGAK